MTLKDHSEQLGGLYANLHSLEFVLRAFLQKQPNARPIGLPHGTDIYTQQIGTELAVSEITSYDSLGTLINKFNTIAAESDWDQIDPSIVEVRDALAHGRVSYSEQDGDEQQRLIKFSRPVNDKVTVTFNQELTMEWFSAMKKLVKETILSVHSRM